MALPTIRAARGSRAIYKAVWRGEILRQETERNVIDAWTRVGLRGEKYAKQNLYKGRGVITGTLRRSIHIAGDGYNWRGDNVSANSGTPERGGKNVKPTIVGNRIRIWIGSGMNYALYVEMGFKSFRGYRYLRSAMARLKSEVPAIIRDFVAKKQKRRSK